MGEFTIELKELHFFAFHGLHEEERRVGGEFVVDLSAKIKKGEKTAGNIGIKDTVNYASLYEIVKYEMMKPQALLETLALHIAEKIHQKFSVIKEIDVRIEKKHPPIIGIAGSVAVRYRRSY